MTKIDPSNLSGYWQPPATQAKASAQDSQAFQKVLTNMMVASSLTQNGDSASGAGISIAPMMMMLMEQLMAGQVNGAGTAAGALPNVASALNSLSGLMGNGGVGNALSNGGDPALPHGQPVNGPVTQNSHPGHVAIDFGVPLGTPVHATMSGKVIYSGWNDQGYGNLVIVENGAYRTYYAHLSELPAQVGQDVAAGGVIGLSGSTGNSTGPHVHYEIRQNGEQIDPTAMTLG